DQSPVARRDGWKAEAAVIFNLGFGLLPASVLIQRAQTDLPTTEAGRQRIGARLTHRCFQFNRAVQDNTFIDEDRHILDRNIFHFKLVTPGDFSDIVETVRRKHVRSLLEPVNLKVSRWLDEYVFSESPASLVFLRNYDLDCFIRSGT